MNIGIIIITTIIMKGSPHAALRHLTSDFLSYAVLLCSCARVDLPNSNILVTSLLN
jgi:hypothetical protein